MSNLHKINGGGYFYHSPEIEVYSTAVEVGFAGTGDLGYGSENAAGQGFGDPNEFDQEL